MTTEDRRRVLLDSIRRSEEELTRLERLSWLDDLPGGTVIRFVKHYPGVPRNPSGRYEYAGLKVGRVWYLTGMRGQVRLSHLQLCDLLETGVKSVKVMTVERSVRLADGAVTDVGTSRARKKIDGARANATVLDEVSPDHAWDGRTVRAWTDVRKGDLG